MVIDGEISQGHARAILPLAAEKQTDFARQVHREGLSVRKTEQAVQDQIHASGDDQLRIGGADGVSRKPTSARNAQIAALQTELQKALLIRDK